MMSKRMLNFIGNVFSSIFKYRSKFKTSDLTQIYVELDIIGHFRISLSLFLKASLGAHPFI